ncbi:MAG TPA: CpsB/CapC family capsule biosynthesis tyrosine phosphatase, partial [Dissulfurispiraceae bacterium]|nr:CpsB/CapC family capsule biosynthesis tyrosine phosphatase [Dissulfurispiraceae bacterium]
IPISILFGAEVNAVLDARYMKDYAIEGTNYILLEFPHTHLPKNAKGILFNMALKGFNPIITHPERNPSIIKNPDLLLNLLDTNIFVQITAGSLAGDFGKDSRECAAYLLKQGVVSFIGSDAHSPNGRRPILSSGLKVAEKIIGKENAFHLVNTNPEAVIKGKAVKSKE